MFFLFIIVIFNHYILYTALNKGNLGDTCLLLVLLFAYGFGESVAVEMHGTATDGTPRHSE
jgi:hypothetical protein